MANRMLNKTWLTQVILIITIIAIAGVAPSCDSSLLSEKAPDFTLPTMTGANVTLSELEGTPVALNFWATWCGYCVTELPYFEAVAQESDGEIEVIAIDVGETVSTVQTFFGDYEPTMTVALDGSAEVFQTYSQSDNPRAAIPVTFFVDSEGIVQYIKIGAFQSETELWNILHDVFGITIP
jgi:thiol-disulfide isomerase/thioredoxin